MAYREASTQLLGCSATMVKQTKILQYKMQSVGVMASFWAGINVASKGELIQCHVL